MAVLALGFPESPELGKWKCPPPPSAAEPVCLEWEVSDNLSHFEKYTRRAREQVYHLGFDRGAL